MSLKITHICDPQWLTFFVLLGLIIIIIINRLCHHNGHINTYIHTYILRYNRKVHPQLKMLFIHHYTSSGKINQTKDYKCWQKYNTWSNNNDETVKTWVISRRLRFIPLYIVNSRNYSTHWSIKSINNLMFIWQKLPDVFIK